MSAYLFVAFGGAVGAAARHAASAAALKLWGPGWPHGTFAVNLTGGLMMGLLAGWLVHRSGAAVLGLSAQDVRLWLATGVLGGFTTFSAFSLEMALMIERKAVAAAALYALVSVLGALGAVFLGLLIARRVFS